MSRAPQNAQAGPTSPVKETTPTDERCITTDFITSSHTFIWNIRAPPIRMCTPTADSGGSRIS